MEYACERENYRLQKEAMGISRMVKRGDAWFPLRVGRNYFTAMNQLAVEVFRTQDNDIEHNFEYGRQVVFFRGEGKEMPTACSVSYVDGDRMVVIVPNSSFVLELERADQLGVALSFDETSYKAMDEALQRAINAKDNRLAQLRDFFYLNTSGKTAPPETKREISLPWLNKVQESAVNKVIWTKDVMIIHGPPGTGKTTTLVEAISEVLRRENQVLVCAQSNMAVDWISERLVDRQINVLRIGNPTRVNNKMLSFTYEHRFESHPDYPELWAIRKTLRSMSGKRQSSESRHQQRARLRERATEIELRIHNQLFSEARVVACTLVGAAHRLMSGQTFHTLFIDEAAQALEGACWIPMRRCRRVILAGDHCQLPPTIKSIAAIKKGLAVTLMERLVKNHPDRVVLLQTQYRMNEAIMRFSSDYFYKGKVEAAPEVRHRSILDFDMPMEWIDTADYAVDDEAKAMFREQFVGESFGRINKGEAELTLLVLERYLQKIGSRRILDESIDIGVISPYRAQVQYLRRKIKKRETFRPFRNLITVNTIDGFQGQERDVIFISLVRSNDKGQIGFLRDLRRMNVAITRARMKLFIVGNSQTITQHPFYKELYERIKEL